MRILRCVFAGACILAIVTPRSHADLLVTSFQAQGVGRFDESTGKLLGILGTAPFRAIYVAYGPDGNLYATDLFNSRVLKFDGKTYASMGVFASGGGLNFANGLTFGPDGHLYVASRATDQILRYNGASGAFMDVFASGVGMDAPEAVVFGPDGNLYVDGFDGTSVVRFDGKTGAAMGTFTSGGSLKSTRGITFLADGTMLVSSQGTGSISRYDTNGAFLNTFASGMNSPNGLVIGPNGSLYVADEFGRRIYWFDPLTGIKQGTFNPGVEPIALLFTQSSIPEPGSMILTAMAIGGAIGYRRFKRSKTASPNVSRV